MELSKIIHVEAEDPVLQFNADIFFTAASYESRAITIAERVDGKVGRKIALAYKELNREFSRQKNDRYFKDAGYEYVSCSASEAPDFHNLIHPLKGRQLNVLLDISCMTHKWYMGLLKYLHTGLHGIDIMNLRVVYLPAEYSDSSNEGKIKRMDSTCTERNNKKDHRKTALLLGISQDGLNVSKIIEKYQPDSLYLFYSDPAPDKRVIEKTLVNNHMLIDTIAIRNLIPYPISNGQQIYQQLSDLALMLRLTHRLVLVPRGPKIFSLVAMALQLSYPDIEVCYPEIRYKRLADRKPSEKPVIMDLVFENE